MPDGKLSSKNIYKYDEKGNEIEDAEYGLDGKIIKKTLSKYDEKGNEIECIIYNPEGTMKRRSTSKYDQKGNEIELYIPDDTDPPFRSKVTPHSGDTDPLCF
ncbi:MAG TPA: hypothetical protein VIK14_15890 [Ignavibacteria bacterium]